MVPIQEIDWSPSEEILQDGTSFPSGHAVSRLQDPRVAVWHSAKMAARLQRASSSGNPVLLNVDYEAGHGLGSAQASVNAQRADIISFMFWQSGMEGWTPQPSGSDSAQQTD